MTVTQISPCPFNRPAVRHESSMSSVKHTRSFCVILLSYSGFISTHQQLKIRLIPPYFPQTTDSVLKETNTHKHLRKIHQTSRQYCTSHRPTRAPVMRSESSWSYTKYQSCFCQWCLSVIYVYICC